MTARLLRGDVLSFARHYHGERFHALLCDPPYELKFMVRRWDGTGISFRPDTWAALGELLHPGAFGMAFASSRGWHRLAVAIEDAGMVIHPSIFLWNFGSGFPKATRIDTQIDKAAGAARAVVGTTRGGVEPGGKYGDSHLAEADKWHNITAPATPLAAAWQGHRYGLQALKPAAEPIIVFQKPYDGKPVECITRTGAGALWVDGGRIDTQGETWEGNEINAHGNYSGKVYGKLRWQYSKPTHPLGRWPANFALVHSPECERIGQREVKGIQGGGHATRADTEGWRFNHHQRTGYADANGHETVEAWDCAPGCPVAALDGQSGERSTQRIEKPCDYEGDAGLFGNGGIRGARGYTDEGGASRFFHRAAWELEHADPVLYQAKASRKERDAGLDAMPEQPAPKLSGGEWVNLNGNGQGNKTVTRRNPHPTIKPIALSRWLATLLLPPPEYAPRRLLVPFAGVGSEMIGAGLAGWDEIVGVEGEAEYVAIGRARLAHWLAQDRQLELG